MCTLDVTQNLPHGAVIYKAREMPKKLYSNVQKYHTCPAWGCSWLRVLHAGYAANLCSETNFILWKAGLLPGNDTTMVL